MWISQYSVSDDEIPEEEKSSRAQIMSNIYFFKPNPEIRGYTMINDQELNGMGTIPNSIVTSAYLDGAIKANTEFYKCIEADAQLRMQKEKEALEAKE